MALGIAIVLVCRARLAARRRTPALKLPKALSEYGMAAGTSDAVCEDAPVYGAVAGREMTLMVDTETTGLALDNDIPCSERPENWPRMVRLSWLVVDADGAIVRDGDLIVRPEGFVIPPEVVEIHGITTERALREGIRLEDALRLFEADADQCRLLVGHNIVFDRNVIGAECRRLGRRDMLHGMPTACTMKLSTAFCAIPHPVYVYKWPRLGELYYILFGHEMEDAHNGAADVRAVHDCYVQLKKLKVI